MEWRAFELHPGIPPEGQLMPYDPERLARGRANFQRLADEAGLPYGNRTHWYDSTPAHQASLWARDRGAEDALRREIYRAYFVEDRNISSADVLVELAQGLGMDAADLGTALAEERYWQQVAREYEEAQRVGVTSVPTFVAGRYAVLGAQPYEVFRQLMSAIGEPPRREQPAE